MKRIALIAAVALAAFAAWAGYYALPLVEGEQAYDRGPGRIAAIDVAGAHHLGGTASLSAVRLVEEFEEQIHSSPTYYQYEQVTRIGSGGRTYTTMEYVQHQTPYELVPEVTTSDGGVTYQTNYVRNYLPVRTSIGFRPVTNWTVGVPYVAGMGRLIPTNLYLLGGESLSLSGASSGGTNSIVTLLLER